MERCDTARMAVWFASPLGSLAKQQMMLRIANAAACQSARQNRFVPVIKRKAIPKESRILAQLLFKPTSMPQPEPFSDWLALLAMMYLIKMIIDGIVKVLARRIKMRARKKLMAGVLPLTKQGPQFWRALEVLPVPTAPALELLEDVLDELPLPERLPPTYESLDDLETPPDYEAAVIDDVLPAYDELFPEMLEDAPPTSLSWFEIILYNLRHDAY